MKSLKDRIYENLQINEASIPAKARKYISSAEEVTTDDGEGWIIGKGFDYYDQRDADIFSENLKLCLDLFGGADIAGEIVTKPIKMSDALDYAESNGEEPEGTMYFVYNKGEKYPMVWSDFLIQWQ